MQDVIDLKFARLLDPTYFMEEIQFTNLQIPNLYIHGHKILAFFLPSSRIIFLHDYQCVACFSFSALVL